MADSEDECDTWRNRDKYPKEREELKPAKSPSPIAEQRPEPRIEKRSFNNNNYQSSPNKSVEPPFKRQRREPVEEYGNFNNNNNNLNNNNRDNRDNRREPSYDNRFNNNINNNSVSKPIDDTPNYPTQPPMLLFKHFLQQQDDDIEMDQAMKKYNEYKESFVTKQLKAFFESHNSQEWFREKYLPIAVSKKKSDIEKNIQMRKEIFMYLYERNWMDNIKIHVDETDSIVRIMDAVVILLEGGNSKDLTILFSKRYRSESPNDSSHDLEEPEPPKKVVTEEKLEKENEKEEKEEEKVVEEGEPEVVETEEIKKTTVEDTEEITNVEEEEGVDKEAVAMKEASEGESDSSTNPTNECSRFEKQIESQEPRALHKTFSIFLRNLHPNVLRSEIEALVKPYNGFLRLALQDPTPDRKFFRRGWVTYDRTVNIKEICWNLNNIRLHDCDIGAIVNRELTQRIRPVMVLANHRPVMRHDVKIASKLVAKFDKRHNLWQKSAVTTSDGTSEPSVVGGTVTNNPMSSNNPLLANITEYLVDEGSYEEEALLGGNLNCNLELAVSGSDPANIKIETDSNLAAVLDRLILYLRFVHSFDYYSTTEYQIEDEMPHRCGILHARGAHIHVDKPLTQREVEEYIKNFEAKADQILNSVDMLTVTDARKLGWRALDEAVDAFIADNTQEIAKDKWLCPLSGKKFKGPDFVQKHILNKHLDKVELVRQNTEFFDNYLLDPRRPQLPEHPSNRPGASKSAESGEIGGNMNNNMNNNQSSMGGGGGGDNFMGNNGNRGYRGDMDGNGRGSGGNNNNARNAGRRNDDFDRRNSSNNNYNNNNRGSSPGGYRDFGGRNSNSNNNSNNSFGGGDNRGSSNGNYYRKNSYPARGGNQSRQRNGGGSYYNRKMMSYNDLDAPMDE